MYRMRTLGQAAAHYKAQDPDTAITYHAIRQLLLQGAIPHVKAGNKYLVALEALDKYFGAEESAP